MMPVLLPSPGVACQKRMTIVARWRCRLQNDAGVAPFTRRGQEDVRRMTKVLVPNQSLGFTDLHEGRFVFPLVPVSQIRV